jgi:hypothetical protein
MRTRCGAEFIRTLNIHTSDTCLRIGVGRDGVGRDRVGRDRVGRIGERATLKL